VFSPGRSENAAAETAYAEHETEIVPAARIREFVNPVVRKQAQDK
jgi:hypothetical protein